MRMWMINPKVMCREHLLGEYRELFTFLGTLRKKKRVDGYLRHNLFEPESIMLRYKELRKEMLRRGYNPRKPFTFVPSDLDYLTEEQRLTRIDRRSAFDELIRRCPACRQRLADGRKRSWNFGLTKAYDEKLVSIAQKISDTEQSSIWKGSIGVRKARRTAPKLGGKPAWNRGLTKETDTTVRYVSEKAALTRVDHIREQELLSAGKTSDNFKKD